MMLRWLVFFLFCAIALAGCVRGANAATHGIAMHGEPKLGAGFTALPYVNPNAPKGGRVVLGAIGSFDSLNPMIIKGQPGNGVREFVIESLMARSLDEPFTLYGLIAERVEVPDDRSSVTFHLNAAAKFSDGDPITARDVLFSYEVLREKGRDNHRTYYKKIAQAEALSERVVRFTFNGGGDREMPLIMGLMPVLPSHLMSKETFDQTTLEPIIGSGPYRISRVEPGRSITYSLNPDYWGRDLPVNRGRFNFAELRYDYYRLGTTLLEAFKTGQITLRSEDDPARWADAYEGASRSGERLVQANIETRLPAGMNAIAFNTRRPAFKDQRVRRALILLFDFEWVNRSVYYGLFKRTQSFFERSDLSSHGRAADDIERALLAPFPDAVASDVMDGTRRLPVTAGTGQNRENWAAALELLAQGGYVSEGGKLVHAATRKPLAFEVLVSNPGHERTLGGFLSDARRLGIDAQLRVVDSAQYESRIKTFDFDMIQHQWPVSLSPGNEQLFRWSSNAAAAEGTFNYAGVANPAVDAMIDAMLKAGDYSAFTSAVRALDRVLISGDYVIPLFHPPKQWVAHWPAVQGPDVPPLAGFNLDSWWSRDARSATAP